MLQLQRPTWDEEKLTFTHDTENSKNYKCHSYRRYVKTFKMIQHKPELDLTEKTPAEELASKVSSSDV